MTDYAVMFIISLSMIPILGYSLSDIASKFLTVTYSRSRKPYKLSHIRSVFEATPHNLINFA